MIKGNYPENVKQAILLRKNWKEVEANGDMYDESHFIWKPTNFTHKVQLILSVRNKILGSIDAFG